MATFSINLNNEEELLTIIRRHFLTFTGSLIKFLSIMLIVYVVHILIPQGTLRMALIIIFSVFGGVFLIYQFIIWYLVSMVVTNERIIDINQTGFSKRIVTEILLSDIAKVSIFKEGFLQNFFNYGTLVVDIKGGGKLAAIKVKNPEFLMENINKLKKDYNRYEQTAKKQN